MIRYVTFESQAGAVADVRWGMDDLRSLAVQAGYLTSRSGIPLSNGWELELFSGGSEPISFLVQTKKIGTSSYRMSYGYSPQPEVIRGSYQFTDGKVGTTISFHCFPEGGINELAVNTGHGSDEINILFESGRFAGVNIASYLLKRLIPDFSDTVIPTQQPIVNTELLAPIKPRGVVKLSAGQVNDYPAVVEAILGEKIAELGEVDVLGTVGSLCQNIERENPVTPADCIHYLLSPAF